MQLNPPSSGLASAVVFVSASLWGLYWIPLRYLEGQGIESGWAIAMLNAPAALALACVAACTWQRQRGQLSRALLIGIFTGFAMALYAQGLLHTSVVRATILFYLTPVWATAIGIVWLGEHGSWQRWLAIAGGLCGLLLLVSGGGSVPLNVGDLFAFLSGVSWAIGAAMIKRYAGVPLSGMSAFQFAVTALSAIVLGYLVGDMTLPSTEQIARVLPTTTLVSIFAFVPAVCVLFWAQKFLFPGRVGLLMMSEVLTAVLTASLLLPEERMSTQEWAGAVLIVGACLVEVCLAPVQAAEPEPA